MLAARVPPLRKIGKVLPALEINDSLQLLSALQWQYMQESMQACSMYAANVEHLRVCSGDAVDVQRRIVYVPALHANQAMAACSSSMAEAGDSNWDFMQYIYAGDMQGSICTALHMQYMHYMQNSI